MTRKYSRRYNTRINEKELKKRLVTTTGILIATLTIVYISLKYFGPKVGSIFMLISKHRNDGSRNDNISPPPPVLSQVPETINKNRITINGITEPGATVKLYINGPEKGKTTSDNDGLFTFINVRLNEGTNIVFAKAIDQNSNVSEKSKVYRILFDDKSPEIEILTPGDGEEIKNLNKRVMVTGTVNEECTITINGRQAIVKPDNSFELLLGVDEGDVEIKVKAVDRAKNESEKAVFIKYIKGS